MSEPLVQLIGGRVRMDLQSMKVTVQVGRLRERGWAVSEHGLEMRLKPTVEERRDPVVVGFILPEVPVRDGECIRLVAGR